METYHGCQGFQNQLPGIPELSRIQYLPWVTWLSKIPESVAKDTIVVKDILVAMETWLSSIPESVAI